MAKPESAEEKAQNLLLQHLTPEQRQMFLKKGYFDFIGSRGSKFRLVSRPVLAKLNKLVSHSTEWSYLWNLQSHFVGHGCVMAYNIWAMTSRQSILPECDSLLAIKLEMEVDENRVQIACSFPFNADILPKLEA